jgi:hypothetical protein
MPLARRSAIFIFAMILILEIVAARNRGGGEAASRKRPSTRPEPVHPPIDITQRNLTNDLSLPPMPVRFDGNLISSWSIRSLEVNFLRRLV